MHRLMTFVVASILFSGCATVTPFKQTIVAHGETVDEAYNCAIGQIGSLGCTMENADRTSGFFKAEKNFVPGPASINWGVPITFELTVFVSARKDNETQMQITGATGKGA